METEKIIANILLELAKEMRSNGELSQSELEILTTKLEMENA
jgi:hypothetical protein